MPLAVMYLAAFGLAALMGIFWAGVVRLGNLSSPGRSEGLVSSIIMAILAIIAGIVLAGYSTIGFWRQINHTH